MASARSASRRASEDMERANEDDDIDNADPLDEGKPPLPRTRTTGNSTKRSTLERAMHGAQQRSKAGAVRRAWRRVKAFVLQSSAREDQDMPILDYRQLPILSGIVVPFSILLELPGLMEHWYVRTDGDKTVEVRPNPPILTAGMSISMTCAVLANFFLLMRFLERSPRVSTFVAIVGLTLHDIINIVVLTAFGVIHRFDDGFTYGESFWITLCSTVASTFVNVTLIYDYVQTKDFDKKGSGLTRKQRSLVIVIMIFLVYIAFGASVNHSLLSLDFVDSIYFTIVSITTIGYGDIVPKTTGSRIFVAFFIIGGILNLSLVLVIMRETVIEAFEQGFRHRKHALSDRRRQHRRSRIEQAARRQAIERQLAAAGHPIYLEKRGRITRKVTIKLNQKALNEEQMSSAIDEAQQVTEKLIDRLPANDPHRLAISSRQSSTLVAETSNTPQQHQQIREAAGDGLSPSFVNALQQELGLAQQSWDAQEEAYRQFQATVAKEESKDRTAKLVVAWSVFLSFWLVGAAIFTATERSWTYGIGLWWCFVSFSTIGFGDYAPTSPAGRAIFAAWALFGVAAMTILISVVGEAYSSQYHNLVKDEAFDRAVRNIRANRRGSDTPPPRSVDPDVDEDLEAGPPDDAAEELAPGNGTTLHSIHETLGQISADLIVCASRLHEDIHFLSTATAPDSLIPPDRLNALIADVEELNIADEKLKAAMMQDASSRKTLFVLGYENRLRKLLTQAQATALQLATKADDIRKTDELLERYAELREMFSSDLDLSLDDPTHKLTRRRVPNRQVRDSDSASSVSGRSGSRESEAPVRPAPAKLLEPETSRTSAVRDDLTRSLSRSKTRDS